jgi:hypothetical protein
MAQQEIPKPVDHRQPPAAPAATSGAAAEVQRQMSERRQPAAPAESATAIQAREQAVNAQRAAQEAQLKAAHDAEVRAQQAQADAARKQELLEAQRQQKLQRPAVGVNTYEGQPGQVPGRTSHISGEQGNLQGATPASGQTAHRIPTNGSESGRPTATTQSGGEHIVAGQQHGRPYSGTSPVYNNINVTNINNSENFNGNWNNRYGFDPHRGRAGFAPVILFNPGESWGWRDRNGWDPNCFRPQYDPNYQQWAPSIHQEAGMVTNILNQGDTQGAAQTLNIDLFNMRGDVYAQNELLSEVRQEQSGQGAYLYLDNWDQSRGTWDTVEVVSPEPPPGYQAAPSYFVNVYDNPPSDY